MKYLPDDISRETHSHELIFNNSKILNSLSK